MKKFYMILAAIAALTMTVQAQNTGSIYVGNWWNPTTTYNTSYFNMAPTNFYVAHTGCQMIYTPDLLTNLDGKQNVKITALDFKLHCEDFNAIFRNVKMYLQETDATEFPRNEEGAKQFFNLGQLVYEGVFDYDFLDYYGEDLAISYVLPEAFAFTPGKSLLVTMVYDAEEYNNCTDGSDYAPFYTSGISGGRAMTYTNNWNSFLDYAVGENFPDVTSGCGTNVELPVTWINYVYGDVPEPTEKTGSPFFNAYSEDGIYGLFLDINESEPSTIYYRIQNAEGEYTAWMEYEGTIVFNEAGWYRVEAYAVAEGKLPSDPIAYEFVLSEKTGVLELVSGKQVANVRYFNLAGQEMQQANGLTIMVTTYTDGTTSAVKVMK